MIEKLLIAVEDDEQRMAPVVAHAGEIAAGLSAEVVLYHVYDPDEFEDQLASRNVDAADPTELAKQNATVEAAASGLRDRGVEFSVVASTGDPAAELVRYIDSHAVDHVFLGGRRRSPAGKALLGSVSQDVMLDAAVPCTLVRGA